MADGSTPAWRRALFNQREGRLRAGLRLLAMVPVLGLALAAGQVAFLGVLAVAPPDGPVATVLFGLGAVALYVAMAAAVLAMARWVDRRGLGAWIAVQEWWRDLIVGLLIGLGMATGAVAAGVASGAYRIVGTLRTTPDAMLFPAPGVDVAVGATPVLVVVATLFGIHLAVGVAEELLLRGYVLTNLAEGVAGVDRVGPRGALAFAALASSALFGVLHVLNPNAALLGTLNIVLAGLFFAATYLATGTLGVPIGVHVAWNFAVVGVYGLPVSGLASPGSLIVVVQAGDATVTGGGFGPEAGLVFYPALALGIVATLAWVRSSRGSLTLREDVAIYDPPERAGAAEQ